MGWGSFKPLLAELVVEALRPLQARYGELRGDPGSLLRVLALGRERASEVAGNSLARVRQALGFLDPPPPSP